MHVLLFRWSV